MKRPRMRNAAHGAPPSRGRLSNPSLIPGTAEWIEREEKFRQRVEEVLLEEGLKRLREIGQK